MSSLHELHAADAIHDQCRAVTATCVLPETSTTVGQLRQHGDFTATVTATPCDIFLSQTNHLQIQIAQDALQHRTWCTFTKLLACNAHV